MPKGVVVGLCCQFTIMPLLGISLALAFNYPAEIAAGVVLIGSSPSGVASNVMAYIAEANLALSITLTAVGTLMAPLVTPLLMELLAGQFVPIVFWAMMWSNPATTHRELLPSDIEHTLLYLTGQSLPSE